MLMQSVFLQVCGTINTLVLSGYSDIAVNASSVANEIFNIGNTLTRMISTGSVIIISIQIGAKNTNDAKKITGTGAALAFLMSLIIALIEFSFAESLMTMMNLRGETLSMAIKYCRMHAIFIPLSGFCGYFSSVIICNGYPKYTFIVGAIGSALKLVLSYAAINLSFFDSLWTPIERVPFFSGLVDILTLLLTLFVFVKKRCPFAFAFNRKYALKIITLGSAGVAMSFMWRMAQSITTAIVADKGDAIINTKIYIGNIISYIPLVGYAISEGNSVFMGRLKGAGDAEKQKRLYNQNLGITVCINLLLSAVVLIIHRPLMRIFTSDEAIINASTIIFVLDILVELPRAVNNISEKSLNANGDVKTTFITSLLSCWLLSVGLSYVFCSVLDMGLIGIWLAFIFDEFFKAIVYLIRWRSEKWRKINI